MSIQNWYVARIGPDQHVEIEGEIEIAGRRRVVWLGLSG